MKLLIGAFLVLCAIGLLYDVVHWLGRLGMIETKDDGVDELARKRADEWLRSTTRDT